MRIISIGSHRAPGATNPNPNPKPKPKMNPSPNQSPTLGATAHLARAGQGDNHMHAPMSMHLIRCEHTELGKPITICAQAATVCVSCRCEHTELGKLALLRLTVDHCAVLTAHAAQKLVLLTAKASSSCE